MWFATARGLVRYDGAHLVVYRHDPNDPGSLPFGAPDLPARGPRAAAVGRHRLERVGGRRGAGQEHGALHALPGGRAAGVVERALRAGDLPGSRGTPVGGARPGHRPLRPGHEDVHGLPDRPRRQRAAGDGDAGGLARHLLGGHGEERALPVRPGHAHVPRASPFATEPRRARARRRRLVLRRLPRAAGRHAVGGRLRCGPRPHRPRQRANETLPARSAAHRLAERRPGRAAGRRRGQARLRRHRERRPRRPRHPLGTVHAPPSRPGRPAQPGQRLGLGALPRRAGSRLGRGQRLRRELALTRWRSGSRRSAPVATASATRA